MGKGKWWWKLHCFSSLLRLKIHHNEIHNAFFFIVNAFNVSSEKEEYLLYMNINWLKEELCYSFWFTFAPCVKLLITCHHNIFIFIRATAFLHSSLWYIKVNELLLNLVLNGLWVYYATRNATICWHLPSVFLLSPLVPQCPCTSPWTAVDSVLVSDTGKEAAAMNALCSAPAGVRPLKLRRRLNKTQW